jgi:hypothetical protein
MTRIRFEKQNNYRCAELERHDCLSCGFSMSEEGDDDGDILHCVKIKGKNNVVDNDKVCDLWN